MAARVQGAVEEDVHAKRHSGDALNYVVAIVKSNNYKDVAIMLITTLVDNNIV